MNDPEKLAARGITATELRTAITDAVKTEVRAPAALFDVRSIGDIVIRVADGTVIRVRDVARIAVEVHQDAVAELDGRRVLLIAVAMNRSKSAGDMIEKELNKLVASLPPDVHLNLAADLSQQRALLVEIGHSPNSSAGERAVINHDISQLLRAGNDTSHVLTIPSDGAQPARMLLMRTLADSFDPMHKQLSEKFPGVRNRVCAVGKGESLIPFPVRIALVGPDRAELKRWRDATVRRLGSEVGDLPVADVPIQRIEFDKAAATRAGLSPMEISDEITLATGGAMTIHLPAGKLIEIRLPATGDPTQRLAQLRLGNNKGERIALSAVAKLSVQPEPATVWRIGVDPAVLITVSVPIDGKPDHSVEKYLAAAALERGKLNVAREYRSVEVAER